MTTTRTVFELKLRAARGHKWKQHVRAFSDADAATLRAAHAEAASGNPNLPPISPLVVSLTEAMARVLRDNPGAVIVGESKKHRTLAEGDEPIAEDGTEIVLAVATDAPVDDDFFDEMEMDEMRELAERELEPESEDRPAGEE